jgi:hypothetical protein
MTYNELIYLLITTDRVDNGVTTAVPSSLDILKYTPEGSSTERYRVTPVVGIQGQKWPSIVYYKRLLPVDVKGHPNKQIKIELQVIAIADKSSLCESISATIRDHISGQKNRAVGTDYSLNTVTWMEQGYEDYDEDLDLFFTTNTYHIKVNINT